MKIFSAIQCPAKARAPPAAVKTTRRTITPSSSSPASENKNAKYEVRHIAK
jgi:hypothetical protein